MKRRRSIAIIALLFCRGEPNSKRMTSSSNLSMAEWGGIEKLKISVTGKRWSAGFQCKVEFTGTYPND